MKKLLILLILAFIVTPALAITNSLEPRWSDIAPAQYINAEYIEDNTFYARHPFASAFSAMAIIPIPFVLKDIEKSSNIDINNYWVRRKKAFDNDLKICNSIEDSDKRTFCYFELKKSEYQKTANTNQLLEQRKQIAATQQLNCNVQQINQNLNGINQGLNNFNNYVKYGY